MGVLANIPVGLSGSRKEEMLSKVDKLIPSTGILVKSITVTFDETTLSYEYTDNDITEDCVVALMVENENDMLVNYGIDYRDDIVNHKIIFTCNICPLDDSNTPIPLQAKIRIVRF